MDIDLAKHLISEVQVERTDRHGRKKIVFEQIAKRNDYLDICTYAIAFSYFLRGRKTIQDRIKKVNIL